MCGLLFINISAGLNPVVEWGVFLYANRNLSTLVCIESLSPFHFFIASLNVLTLRSANPFVAG